MELTYFLLAAMKIVLPGRTQISFVKVQCPAMEFTYFSLAAMKYEVIRLKEKDKTRRGRRKKQNN